MHPSHLRRASAGLGALVAAHLTWLLLDLPGGRAASDLLFVLVPAAGVVACLAAARRATGPARLTWALLTATQLSWVVANAIWGYYEVVLDRQVPTPSPADGFYTLALVVAVGAVVTALVPLVPGRIGGFRVLLDVVLVGGSLLFISWGSVLLSMLDDDLPSVGAVSWLYPALGVTAAVVALNVRNRVHRPAELPWLCLCAAFLAGSVADTAWAHANVSGGFSAGSALDPVWVLTYGGVALAAVASAGDSGLADPRTLRPRRESLMTYIPVAGALGVAIVRQLQDDMPAGLLAAGTGLVAVLLVRQVLSVLEHDDLARTLESRVATATAGLQASEARMRSIVANISDVVLVVDADARIRYQSPSAGTLLGYDDGELLGVLVSELAHPDDLASVRAIALKDEKIARRSAVVPRVRRRDGSWRHIEATIANLLDDPTVEGLVLTLRDVEEEMQLQERLRHQAYHDGLTGLANRVQLQETLDDLLAEGHRPSLLLLDLDEFKAVNDTAGHDLGDQVLVAVARRLRRATRPGDMVSRIGGDEFAVVLPDGDSSVDAFVVGQRVLSALREPLLLEGRQIRCLGSVGVATAEAGSSAAELLRDADTAMYVAKGNGKGRVERFTVAMRETVLQRQATADLVRRAVAEGRLVLHYQPVLDLAADRFVGTEALLRLVGEQGELVSPAEFVPIAEETGAIVEIGEWVLRAACLEAAGWQALRPDGPPFDVAVNVSTRQLQEPGLPDAVARSLAAAGLPACLLTLEITEGAIAADDPDVDRTLAGLRALGVRLSIDDFGTGYSSLGRLRYLEVDEVKIDRAFVAELDDGAAEAPLIDAVLAIAARLGLSVVAEGIETIAQAWYLRAAECGRGQGFLFARPLPADDVASVLAGSPAEQQARASSTY